MRKVGWIGWLWLLLVPGFWGCNPEQFTLYRSRGVLATDAVANGIILSFPYDSVTLAERGTVLKLRDGAVVLLRNFGVTQYTAHFFARIDRGRGLTLYLHPVVINRQIVDSGFVLRLHLDRWELWRQGQWIAGRAANIEVGKWVWVQLYRFGEQLQCIVDCDTISVRVQGPATDWIGVQVPPQGAVELRQWRWESEVVHRELAE